MTKFSGTRPRPLRANLTAPVRTTGRRTLTHEGGPGFVRDAELELFLLAATNSSMTAPVSGRSKLSRVEVAAVMAMATARRSTDVDVVIFCDGNRRVDDVAGTSVLAGVAKVVGLVGSVGHSTFGHTAVARHFDPSATSGS
jgi:hypothetical protein